MTETPNPTRLLHLLNAETVAAHRNLFCAEYDDCLETAAGAGWTSWSCEACPLARRRTRPLEHLLAACAASSDQADEPASIGTL